MNLNYKSYSIEYDYIYNERSDTIVFLHGWGGSKKSFAFLFPYLQKYNLLAVSFPPYFTKENYQDSVIDLTLEDYLNILTILLELHNIKNVHIICHSFGFRICLLLVNTNFHTKSIVATGGAGINLYKTMIKKIKLNSKIIWNKKLKIVDKSLDINNLKNNDKKTFKNIIKIDITPFANNMKIPSLLFWGKRDSATPYKVAKRLKKINQNSTLVTTDSDHFAYINYCNLFTKEVLKFLKEKV